MSLPVRHQIELTSGCFKKLGQAVRKMPVWPTGWRRRSRSGTLRPFHIEPLRNIELLRNIQATDFLFGGSFRTSQRPKRSCARYGLGARADGQLQEDMLNVRFHCLRRDLENPGDTLVGEASADHGKDLALPCRERIADAAAGLRETAIRIGGIPPGQRKSHIRTSFAMD